ELAFAFAHEIFGSVDINRGDPQLGWDTDQFPHSAEDAMLALYVILRGGGFTTGGCNFDAKLRRQSLDPADLFHAHIGGIDTLARGLLGAARMLEAGELEAFVAARYAGWDSGLGQAILKGEQSLAELAQYVAEKKLEPAPVSGRQERLENLVNRYL
ncbi:MAG: xylose isomerase, partial [Deltaproteobacteria bacterium]|nr:xylose isomerase [Deltaproteobacteria bacterium]